MMEADFHSAGRYRSGNTATSASGAIPEDRSLDILKSKRFSIGALGDYSDHFPATSLHGPRDEGGMKISMGSSPEKVRIEKCRRGSLGFLNSSFFDDYAKINRRSSLATLTVNRRSSLASVGTFASEGMGQEDDDDDSEISEVRCSRSNNLSPSMSLHTTYTASHHLTAAHLQPQRQPDAQQALPVPFVCPVAFHSRQFMPGLFVTEMNQVMDAFCAAMTHSHKSQQAIHDWDKKMGLKRSHSKTMRLTMRSRKKLKSMLKKQLSKVATH